MIIDGINPPRKLGAPIDAENASARTRVPMDDGNVNRASQSAILECIADGVPVKDSCQLVGIDKRVLYQWIENDPIFCGAYRMAQRELADTLAEKPAAIVDKLEKAGKAISHEEIGVAKLGVDVYRWRAKTLNPAVYGDKIQAEHSGKGGGPIDVAIQVEFVSTK